MLQPDSIPLIDGPELESLGFESADNYRHGAGPAHLTGNSILSSEAGAVAGSVYTQTIQDLLQIVRTGLAGGISMNVLHGFPYSGPFFNTSWPGFAIFSYIYTEMWTPRQPAWRHLNSTMGYITRNQFALQVGKPRVDIAVIEYQPRFDKANPYDLAVLERRGYTYEYLSPGNLELPEAVASDALLAPDGPAYQALMFLNQTKMTVGAARKVRDFAAAGVPILFVESSEFTSIGQKEGDALEVARLMSSLVSSGLPNVVTVSSFAEIEGALIRARVTPRTSFAESVPAGELWHTFRRKIASDDLVWVMNNGFAKSTVRVQFADTKSKIPFSLNAWTGAISPVLEYLADDSSSITIPVTLSAGETAIYAFITEESHKTAPDVFPRVPEAVATHSEGVAGFFSTTWRGRAALAAMIPRGEAVIALTSGQQVHHTSHAPNATTLGPWNIRIESWRGADDYETSGETSTETFAYDGVDLAAWQDLDTGVLDHVSGTAEYRTTFDTPATTQNATLGALLHLGALRDSARVWLNGKLQAPVDPVRGDVVVDLTESLAEPGARNAIEIETASTLYNALQGDPDGFYTAGVTASVANAAYFEANGPKPYGLTGPVWVEWVELVVI